MATLPVGLTAVLTATCGQIYMSCICHVYTLISCECLRILSTQHTGVCCMHHGVFKGVRVRFLTNKTCS